MGVSEAGRVTFDPQSHTYTVDGRTVPSVTQILRECGMIDTAKYGDGSAAVRGTYVAEATEYDDQGALDEDTLDPRLIGYVDAWRSFRAHTSAVIVASEGIVYDSVYGYAGRFDRIVRIHGQTWLLDLKTGGQEPWHSLQTAAYCACLDDPGMRRGAVYLTPTGGYRLVEHSDPSDLVVFRSAVAVAAWKRSHCRITGATDGHVSDHEQVG